MGWMKQETAYERRLRELEEEAERVRKSMQQIMRNVDRNPPGAPAAPAQARIRSTVYQRQVLEPDVAVTAGSVEPAPAGSEPEVAPAERFVGRERPAPVSRQERLANYLASGSFGKAGSLSRERRIQRNKAIFMLLFALLAIFSLITWLK